MSEDDGTAVPPPLILDTSVLTAIARADAWVTSLLMNFDETGQPLIIPPLAAIAALTDLHTTDAARALRGLELLGNVTTGELASITQASAVAYVIARTGMEPGDAHTAALSLTEGGRILTLDAARWRQNTADLDEPLFIVEIADPENGAAEK